MVTKIKPMALVAGMLSLALAGGCESTDLLAPSDGSIIMTATPETIVIDADAGQTSGQSTLLAQVLDSSSRPVQGVSVLFSTSGGVLGSLNSCGAEGTCVQGGQACGPTIPCPPITRKTDANGIAADVLTMTDTGVATATVTARSSSLIDEFQVTRSVNGNTLPDAVLVADPADQQEAGITVEFDGSDSEDPDGDLITCYEFTIASSIASSNESVRQAAPASTLLREYADEQRLSVTLRVSDTSESCATTDQFGPLDDLAYFICDNDAPQVTQGGDPPTQTLPNVSVTFRAIASGTPAAGEVVVTDDVDAFSQLSFTWNCGNGAQTAETGDTVTCVYSFATTFQATMDVTDSGNPLEECALTNSDTSFAVAVIPAP